MDLNNLTAGIYTVTTTDATGCTKVTSILVSQPTQLVVTLNSQVNVTCFGGNNGAIDINVSGGTLPYTYFWSNPGGANTQDITGLTAGTYTVTVSDGNGCTKTLSATITSPTAITPSVVVTPATCGASNGAIDLSVTGGAPGYTYLWSNGGATTQDLTNILAGTYTVTITNTAGCTTSTSAIVANNTATCTPGIQIVKLINGEDANTAPGVILLVPTGTPPTVNFSFVVTNTGNLTLTNVVVTDNVLIPSLIGTIPTLAPGQSVTLTATALAMLSLHTNIATVSGQPVNASGNPIGTPVTDTDPANYTGVFINMDKIANVTQVCPGEPVTYTLITRMLGGFTGLEIRNVKAMDNNMPGDFVCNGQYWVTCANNGGINCDLDGDCVLDFTDFNGDMISDEEFKWTYTTNIFQTTVNIANDMGQVWYVNPATGAQTFIGNVGNSDQVTVTVNPALCAQLGNFVWSDTNGDGLQQSGEPGIPNVTVNLYTDNNNDGIPDPGAPLATTTTNGTGFYAFTGLIPGNYIVGFVTPTGGYTPSPANVGNDDLIDSDANPVTGYTGTINLSQGETDNSNDAGFVLPSASIGNFVWVDNNANGIQDPLEPGLSGVTVNLYVDNNNDGFPDGVPVATTTTNGTGFYSFTGLLPGNYIVGFVPPSGGYTASPANQGSNDNVDSDNIGGFTTTINLSPGENDNSIDAGFFIPATIGNFVWNDINQNGLQDGEPGISGVLVSLYADADNNGIPDSATPISTQLTGANGSYSFGGLTPGTYIVGFQTPPNYQATTPNVGNNDAIDSDNVGGLTGSYTLVSGQTNNTVDAGFIQLAAVGNFVWADNNGNGIQDGEPGIPGVTVNLISNGMVIATTTTNANGAYSFTGLLPGSYQIEVVLPSNYSGFTINVSGNPTLNSDVNPATGITAVFTLTGGQTNNDIDAGLIQVASLGNFVWEDFNGNGLQDNGEPGIEGVTVTLYGANNNIIATTTTDNNGFYQFTGLNPGNYVVGFTDPVGNWNNSPANVNNNNNDAFDSDPNPITGLTGVYTLLSGQNNQTIDAGFIRVCNLAVTGVVTNASCGSSNGAINVTVTGAFIGATFAWSANANGATSEDLTGLSAGSYTVTVTDQNGCSQVRTFNVSQTGSPALVANANNVSCFGLNNGSITLTVTGGATPYQFSWSNGATTQNISNLAPGTYCVTVTDGAGCSAAACATITQPNQLTVTAVATQATCGINNGKVTTSANGGNGTYNYNWSNGANTPNLNNVGAGTYTVTVTSGGCTATASATVIQTGKPTIAAAGQGTTIIKVSCAGGADGSIDISVTGGTLPYTYDWADVPGTSNQEDRTGLTAGTYTVTVTDNLGCSDVKSFLVGSALPITMFFTTTPAYCGQATGTITPAPTGGSPVYSYTWSDGSTDPIRTGLVAGQYCVTLTDSKGCTKADCVTVPGTSAITVTWVVTPASCGQCNGKIDLTISGGGQPYQIDWFDIPGGWDTEDRTGLCAGTYAAWIYAPNLDCKRKIIISVPSTSNLALATSVVNASCGSANGSATVTATGTGPFTYLWSNTQTTATATNLAAGTYTVTVTAAGGCSATATATVANGSGPAITTQVTNTTCGLANGGVTLTVTGGATPYTYDWAHINGTNNPANLTATAAGQYCVTVTDNAGCTATKCVTLNASAAITASATTGSALCNQSNGSVTTAINGGLAPYSYNWNVGATTANLTNRPAGTYTVTITDAAGCSATTSATISNSGGATATATAINATCGLNNGSATVTATGGAAPYTYLWVGGFTTTTISNLTAGIYNVVVTDANECMSTATVVVNSTPAVTLTTQTSNATCGLNNGTATVSVTTGTAPYLYAWSNGATTATVSNLTGGTITVTVTDSNGCSKTATATVTATTATTATAATTPAACGQSNGSVTITATGSAPFTYTWAGSNATGAVRQNLASGNYTVTVTATNGCSTVVTATVGTTNGPSATATASAAACGTGNGTATVTVSNGTAPFAYVWTSGATTATASNLPAGTYTVTVTDNNGCSTTASATVTPAPSVSLATNVTNSTCGQPNGVILLTPSGGTGAFTYNWDFIPNTGQPEPKDVGGLAAGNYCLTVTDASGCTTSTCVAITTTPGPDATATATNTSCGLTNGSVVATVVGGSGLTYLWNTGATMATLNNVAAGTYTVTVTATGGCTDIATATVNSSAALTATANVTNIGCTPATATGAITINATGAVSYTYAWANGATTQTISGLAAGTYCATVTGNNGCTTTVCGTVLQGAPPTITADVTNVACNGSANGKIILNIAGGLAPFTYDWAHLAGNNDPKDLGNLSGGTYSVTVKASNGCTATASYTVSEPALLYLDLALTPATCAQNDGVVIATVVGGVAPFIYDWAHIPGTNNPITTITNAAPGEYKVTVTDANGCTYATMGEVTAPAKPVAGTTNALNPTCTAPNSGALTATSSVPATYLWSNGATTATITGLAAGTYTVTVTSIANGCTATATATLTNPSAVNAVITAQVNPTCTNPTGGSISVNATSGVAPFIYDWSHIAGIDNLKVLTGLVADTYTVVITDANGCSNTLSVSLVTPNAPSISITNKVNVNCNGAATGSITTGLVNGTAPFTYKWSNNMTTANISNLAAGTYTVTVTDANLCTHTVSTVVTEPSAINITEVITNVNCNGNTSGSIVITATGGTGAFTYDWSHIAGTSNPKDLSNITAGAYLLTITDVNGCTKAKTITVTQPGPLGLQDVTTGTTCNTLTGSILLTPIGGTPSFKYDWSHIPGTDNQKDLINIDAGNYTVTVTDANGCTFAKTMTVSIVPTFNAVATTVASNCTTPTGGIDLTVSGTVAPFTYDWADVPGALNTEDRTFIAGGTYTVTVSDATGCTSVVEVVVPQPVLNVVSQTENTVCGQTTGEIDLTVTGGATPYQYNWSYDGNAGPNPQDIFNLAAGLYVVTVTDANGCTAIISNTITQPGGPQLSTTTTPVACNGSATGGIDLSVTGGAGNYTYNWYNITSGVEPQDQSGLVAGTYAVTVTDGAGCQVVTAVTLAQPAVISVTMAMQNVSCGGINDGTIALGVTGGTAPFTYKWNNNATTKDLTGLTAGFYTVTVTDAKGCTATKTAAINAAPQGITIGSYVWHDADQDGVQNALELGTPNITVKLIKAGVDGTYGTNDDIIVASTTTSATGQYKFGCVVPGTYVVMFGGIPATHQWTKPNAAVNDCKDSDVSTSGMSPAFTVVSATSADILCLDAGHHIACHNVLHPGLIASDQTICSGQSPALLYEVQAPTGGSGTIEYLWMTLEVTSQGTQWVAIPNSNTPVYQPGPLTQTSYFMRCARRAGCLELLETNVITITVLKPGVGNCEEFKPDFTVTKMGDDDAMIDWTTLPEFTQYLYMVQFSTDQSKWVDLANVVGHGNSNAPNWYNHIHYEPVCGRNYYRIMRMDAYGNESMSDVKYIDIEVAAELDAIQFFPNPTKDFINISKVSTCGMDEDATITIFAANGDLLREEVVTRETVGTRTIDISQLPSAVYLVRVRLSNGDTKTVRVTKI
jgi:hypothetical protein